MSALKHPYLSEQIHLTDEDGYAKRDGKKVKAFGENIRPEIVALFNKIVHTMNFKTITITPEEQAKQNEVRKEQTRKTVESWLKSIRQDFAPKDMPYEPFDRLAERIRNLDLGDGRAGVTGSTFSMSPVVAEIRNLYQEKTGRKYSLDQIKGLQSNIDHLKYLSEKDDASHVPQTRGKYSDYEREAAKLDKGKSKAYWNTNREKFARAFDAFITDSITEKAAKNTYLSGIEAAPPLGEERKAINQAFRELVDEVKTRETDQGVAMYSIQERNQLDRDYFSAIESGDMEAAQKMVDEAAKKAGYKLKGFHETDDETFTVFEPERAGQNYDNLDLKGVFFSKLKEDAGMENREGLRTISAFLKFDNPLIETMWTGREIPRHWATAESSSVWFDNNSEMIYDAAEEGNHDGIIIQNRDKKDDVTYIVFDSSQIKSADPITRDDQGNIIPLSHRFDTGKDDVRYSPEENNDTAKRLDDAGLKQMATDLSGIIKG